MGASGWSTTCGSSGKSPLISLFLSLASLLGKKSQKAFDSPLNGQIKDEVVVMVSFFPIDGGGVSIDVGGKSSHSGGINISSVK